MQRRQTVDWIVLTQPIEVDEDDIARFAKLYPMNARPVQSRDRRFILSSIPRHSYDREQRKRWPRRAVTSPTACQGGDRIAMPFAAEHAPSCWQLSSCIEAVRKRAHNMLLFVHSEVSDEIDVPNLGLVDGLSLVRARQRPCSVPWLSV
jgi:hypothetical protein